MPTTSPAASRRLRRAFSPCFLAAVLALAATNVCGQGGPRPAVVIDARQIAGGPKDLPFSAGGRSPAGQVLAANSRYLLRDGRPWLPVMGEFHYSRYPADEWEHELLKMKAGGVEIVATYVFWIHHEEAEGQFNWSGQRDLRRFITLCVKHGLYSWIRVGPWAHGECRNGGLPDWVVRAGRTRENDPAYLDHVRRFYGEIGRQVAGLFWKDGGPIVGVQIENEYSQRGPGKGEEHVLELKRLAEAAGLVAPFYTLTGWDDAAIPERGFLPVFGGYPDGFWPRELTDSPPSPNYFMTPIRCYENVGGDLRSLHPQIDRRQASFPFLTAEMGGGMASAYHRRPVISADDTAAMVVAKLGSGAGLYGYYMFHGGTNPEGRLTTLQESQATGYWNDVPLKGYDFQAPLGEFGQMSPSFGDLKALHLFLGDFGENIAPMAAVFADPAPRGLADQDTPRVAARSDGQRAFLCINNHEHNRALPSHASFQVRIRLASETLDVPRAPTTLPGGAYVIWPVNLDLGPATLAYSTAQLAARLPDPATYVFFAWPGISPELAFAAQPGLSVDAPAARLRRESGRVVVDGIEPGTDVAIRLRGRNGESVQIVVLTREQARQLWKARLDGRERLLLSPADLFFDGDRVHAAARQPEQLEVAVFPALSREVAGFRRLGLNGIFERHAATRTAAPLAAEVRSVRDAGAAPAVRIGALGVATPPAENDLAKAAVWRIGLPVGVKEAGDRLFLRIVYEGDLARLYAGSRLVTDDFYKGTPWEIGLWRLSREELARGVELRIMPLRKDAPIYLPAGARPDFSSAGEVVALKDVRLVREYGVDMDLGRGPLAARTGAR
jgi:beta-galactosidase